MDIYLNNNRLEQVDKMKYLGIIIDNKFKFNGHINYINDRCTKLINALSKSASISWRLRHDALKIIYNGAILSQLLIEKIVDTTYMYTQMAAKVNTEWDRELLYLKTTK